MPANQSDGLTKVARDALTAAAVTLAPLGFAVIRLYIDSHGDPQSFTTLLASVNAIAIIVTGLMLAGPMFCLLLYFKVVENPGERYLNGIKLLPNGKLLNYFDVRLYAVPCLLIVLSLSYPLTAGLFVFFGALIPLAGLCTVDWWVRRAVKRQVRYGRPIDDVLLEVQLRRIGRPMTGMVAGCIATGLFGMLVGSGIGRPIELVQVKNETPLNLGYVVAVDDVDLTLMYQNGRIRHIPTDDVLGRFTCPVGSPALAEARGVRERILMQEIQSRVAASDFGPPIAECSCTNIREK